MTLRRALGGALAAVLGCSSPALADDVSPAPVSMRCAVWAALTADYVEDPEAEDAYRLAFVYFVGVAEGETGMTLDKLLTPSFVEREGQNMDELDRLCAPLMAEMGNRLSQLGSDLERYGGERPTE